MWITGFVDWYNNEHLHSAIRYVTPNQRHLGWDAQMLAARHNVYQLAHARNPARWTRNTRDWSRPDLSCSTQRSTLPRLTSFCDNFLETAR